MGKESVSIDEFATLLTATGAKMNAAVSNPCVLPWACGPANHCCCPTSAVASGLRVPQQRSAHGVRIIDDFTLADPIRRATTCAPCVHACEALSVWRAHWSPSRAMAAPSPPVGPSPT
jgi:hypothetical protein